MHSDVIQWNLFLEISWKKSKFFSFSYKKYSKGNKLLVSSVDN